MADVNFSGAGDFSLAEPKNVDLSDDSLPSDLILMEAPPEAKEIKARRKRKELKGGCKLKKCNRAASTKKSTSKTAKKGPGRPRKSAVRKPKPVKKTTGKRVRPAKSKK